MLKRYRLVSIVGTLLFCALAFFYFSSTTAEAASSSTGRANQPKPPTVGTSQPKPPTTGTNQPKPPTTGTNRPNPPAGRPNQPQPPLNNGNNNDHNNGHNNDYNWNCPSTVELGSTDDAVRELQQSLKDRGYTGPDGRTLQVNDNFGYETQVALKHFEADHHLSQDGVAGPNVWRALGIACR